MRNQYTFSEVIRGLSEVIERNVGRMFLRFVIKALFALVLLALLFYSLRHQSG